MSGEGPKHKDKTSTKENIFGKILKWAKQYLKTNLNKMKLYSQMSARQPKMDQMGEHLVGF